jgi:hypothetical protein
VGAAGVVVCCAQSGADVNAAVAKPPATSSNRVISIPVFMLATSIDQVVCVLCLLCDARVGRDRRGQRWRDPRHSVDALDARPRRSAGSCRRAVPQQSLCLHVTASRRS